MLVLRPSANDELIGSLVVSCLLTVGLVAPSVNWTFLTSDW
jgi:hypothetical protein